LHHDGGIPLILNPEETVAFRMLNSVTRVLKVNDAAFTIIDRGTPTSPAEVQYDWRATDTDAPGTYAACFVIQWHGENGYIPTQDPSEPKFRIVIKETS
jgi:hypothetical protein